MNVETMMKILESIPDKKMEIVVDKGLFSHEEISGVNIEKKPGGNISYNEDGIAIFSEYNDTLCLLIGDTELRKQYGKNIEYGS